jgi:hypothetical protein
MRKAKGETHGTNKEEITLQEIPGSKPMIIRLGRMEGCSQLT